MLIYIFFRIMLPRRSVANVDTAAKQGTGGSAAVELRSLACYVPLVVLPRRLSRPALPLHSPTCRLSHPVLLAAHSILPLQLDWTSNTSRRKINLPTNQKGYDNPKNTVRKLPGRRIQICQLYFSVIIFDLICFKTIENMVPTKIYPEDLNLPRRIL